MSVYVDRFKAAVACYTVRAGSVSETTDRQFGILLIQNADMSPDMLNSITFQVLSCAKLSLYCLLRSV